MSLVDIAIGKRKLTQSELEQIVARQATGVVDLEDLERLSDDLERRKAEVL